LRRLAGNFFSGRKQNALCFPKQIKADQKMLFSSVYEGLLSISLVFKNINTTNLVNAGGVRWF